MREAYECLFILRNGVIIVEKTTGKKKGEILKEMGSQLWSMTCTVAKKVGQLPFWGMAFLCLVLRLFMVCPLGACAAIAVSCVWLYWNMAGFKTVVLKGLWGLLKRFGGHEQHSLWFEHEGRQKICAVISRLSGQGSSSCDLAKELDDLPSENQWYAICSGLNGMGIMTQVSHKSLYIVWHLPAAQ